MMERVREGATVDGEGTVNGHRCMERIAQIRPEKYKCGSNLKQA
jgi:hypothetical protein